MSIWLSLIANPVFHNQYGLRICRRHTSVFHWQPILVTGACTGIGLCLWRSVQVPVCLSPTQSGTALWMHQRNWYNLKKLLFFLFWLAWINSLCIFSIEEPGMPGCEGLVPAKAITRMLSCRMVFLFTLNNHAMDFQKRMIAVFYWQCCFLSAHPSGNNHLNRRLNGYSIKSKAILLQQPKPCPKTNSILRRKALI